MSRVKFALISLVLVAFASGCESEEEEGVKEGGLDIHIGYSVDGLPLAMDTLLYTNDAGNLYAVHLLNYFLSDVCLVRGDSSLLPLREYQYVDLSDPGTNRISCTGIPARQYIGLCFNLGLDSAQNVTNHLPNIARYNNMEWPVPMGGGYHFMKLEGYFLHNDTLFGFSMHMGLNENLVPVKLYAPIVVDETTRMVSLEMNLNEWFRTPAILDFRMENYTMGDTIAMQKLSTNGRDAFTMQ